MKNGQMGSHDVAPFTPPHTNRFKNIDVIDDIKKQQAADAAIDSELYGRYRAASIRGVPVCRHRRLRIGSPSPD